MLLGARRALLETDYFAEWPEGLRVVVNLTNYFISLTEQFFTENGALIFFFLIQVVVFFTSLMDRTEHFDLDRLAIRVREDLLDDFLVGRVVSRLTCPRVIVVVGVRSHIAFVVSRNVSFRPLLVRMLRGRHFGLGLRILLVTGCLEVDTDSGLDRRLIREVGHLLLLVGVGELKPLAHRR